MEAIVTVSGGSLQIEARKTVVRRLAQLLAVIVVAFIPALVGRDSVAAVAALYALADSANPYWVPEQALLFYIWMPIVVVSACTLFLAPGLILVLALRPTRQVGEWILFGFGLSLVITSLAAGLVQAVSGVPLRGEMFAGVVVACTAVSFGLLCFAALRRNTLALPFEGPHALPILISMLVVPCLILIALLPKFFWENFNGDGAHAYEAARLLLYRGMPFWDPAAGDVASFPGLTSMLFAFPASCFIRFFGPLEAAVRLPYLMYLVALYSAILAVVEYGRATTVGLAERVVLWLPLGIYTVVVAYSATYNPYAADIALPATQDTLLMVCYLGFIYAYLRQDSLWLYFFIALTYMSLPSGVLLIGFWLTATLLLWRPLPWKQTGRVALGVIACFVIAGLVQFILPRLGLPPPGQEYGALGLLRHFAWLQWSDTHRLLFVIVPCGILPALSLLAWHWQDRIARTLTVVTLLYFSFFYFSGYTILHYFIPTMVLPILVFWRLEPFKNVQARPVLLAATAIAGVFALWLSLPSNLRLDTSGRVVGMTIDQRLGGYEKMDPLVFKNSELLGTLFPPDWDARVPAERYGGSPLVWNYYAHQPKGEETSFNYVLQKVSDPAPAGMQLVTQDGDASLYLQSESILANQLALTPPTPAGSSLLVIPRGMIFRTVPLQDSGTIISVVDLLDGWGLPVFALLHRFGISP